jgi:GT2 family glycosyltransferase
VKKEFPYPDLARADQEMMVGYFVGAGHAIRKAVFEEVGLYPDDFMYGVEELDFSYRMVNAGYRILYTPQVTVLHKASPGGRLPTGEVIRHLLGNRVRVVFKYLPYVYWPSHVGVWMIFLLWQSLRSGSLRGWAVGVRDAANELASISREPLNDEAVVYLRQVRGRLWY